MDSASSRRSHRARLERRSASCRCWRPVNASFSRRRPRQAQWKSAELGTACSSAMRMRPRTEFLELQMSTIRLHQTTTLMPSQYIARLIDFGPGRQKLFGNSADEDLEL